MSIIHLKKDINLNKFMNIFYYKYFVIILYIYDILKYGCLTNKFII